MHRNLKLWNAWILSKPSSDQPGSRTHSPLDPGYIRIEAILQPSIQVHMDCGLSKGEVKLEITQEEALQLAPMLMQTIQKLMEEELLDPRNSRTAS